MSQVKISELPTLTTPNVNNVMVLNDVSDSTTKKATLHNALFINTTLHLMIPTGLTITVAGNTVNTLDIPCVQCGDFVGFARTRFNNLTITNNTDSAVALEFTSGGQYFDYDSPYFIINCNMHSLVNSLGETSTGLPVARFSLNHMTLSSYVSATNASQAFGQTCYIRANSTASLGNVGFFGFYRPTAGSVPT